MDHSKIGKSSKRKGNTYERRVAKLLTECTGINFRKVPASGGFNKFGGVSVVDRVFCGDVICDRADFRFSVEAKNRKNFSFVSILKNPNTAPFSKWWAQCYYDAKENDLYPMMIFKPDKQEDFVCLDVCGFDVLKCDDVPHFFINAYGSDYANLRIIEINDAKNKIEVEVTSPYILRWKDLVKHVDSTRMFAKWDVVEENQAKEENQKSPSSKE